MGGDGAGGHEPHVRGQRTRIWAPYVASWQYDASCVHDAGWPPTFRPVLPLSAHEPVEKHRSPQSVQSLPKLQD